MSEVQEQKTHLLTRMDFSESKRSSAMSNTADQTLCYSNYTQADLLTEIAALKEKAHQSFMQVIQIQQLHEEEIELLQEEYSQKEQNNQIDLKLSNQKQLELAQQLEQYEKSSRRHQIIHPDLVIDNIDAISCEGNESKLDDSSIIQFRDILSHKDSAQKIRMMKLDLIRGIKLCAPNLTWDNQEKIDQTFQFITELKRENAELAEKLEKLEREKHTADNEFKNMLANYDALQKEKDFMSEHIKRISNEKVKLEKKVAQLNKSNHALEINVRKLRKSLGNSPEEPIRESACRLFASHRLDFNSQLSQLGSSQMNGSSQVDGSQSSFRVNSSNKSKSSINSKCSENNFLREENFNSHLSKMMNSETVNKFKKKGGPLDAKLRQGL